MKVLVTGGAGFVGTNLIKRLLKDGHEIVSVDNYSTGKKENQQDGCVYHDIDISKTSLLYMDWMKPDIIYHMAARARIQPSIDNPHRTFESNTIGTENILEYARNENIPVVYAGSSSVHGDIYANPYTFSKYQGEELCKLYTKVYNLPTAICRFYNVYGEYQLTEGDYCCVLGIFERQFTNGEPLTITGDGEQRRDFTYVGDIVDGLVKCGKSLYMAEIQGEEFELGNGNNRSINELAEAFGDYPTEYIDSRPGEMRETLNTDDKARDVLKWIPTSDIIKFIKEKLV
jgi:UDP-glucose 4-epimerase